MLTPMPNLNHEGAVEGSSTMRDLQQVASDPWATMFSLAKKEAGMEDLKVTDSFLGHNEPNTFSL